jgi:hypothetical protein
MAGAAPLYLRSFLRTNAFVLVEPVHVSGFLALRLEYLQHLYDPVLFSHDKDFFGVFDFCSAFPTHSRTLLLV